MEPITISVRVDAPVAHVWQCFTSPEAIMQWNAASDDWHTTRATNNLRVGGSFSSRMDAKDGSAGFDFEGTYTEVTPESLIAYTMSDGRRVSVHFVTEDDHTLVTETFDPEDENPPEMQRTGWQAILENFKKYAESEL